MSENRIFTNALFFDKIRIMENNSRVTFNELLKKVGIKPEEVVYVWHNEKAMKAEKCEFVADYETYTIHQPKNRKALKRNYWAVFISEGNEKARFYKLYRNNQASENCDCCNKDKVIHDLVELYILEDYVNRLIVEWGKATTNGWSLEADEKKNEKFISAWLERPRGELVFEGFDNIRLSWYDLKKVLQLPEWQTALSNQKAVYLQTDKLTNKHYIGSATGKESLLQRWGNYVSNGHGGNKGLKKLDFDYIQKNFEYSVLETFPNKTDDKEILNRESWHKRIFQTTEKEFGYNEN
ncbi:MULTISPECIES: GIY-YIG nuclease family protein [unclassified Lysinibacillus]|uniref:GIY-YIG nuclease family protein n=1 Tax=unclassified Lysinibacillus TaxID=2636778 RepID=UPI0037FE24E8